MSIDGSGDVRVDRMIDIVTFFDARLREDSTIEQLLRETASWAGCCVGVQFDDALLGIMVSPDGRSTRDVPVPTAFIRRLDSGVTVWSDRAGGPRSDDDFLTERLGTVISITHSRLNPSASEPPTESALLETVLSASADRADRARALRALGYGGGRVRVLALAGRPGDVGTVSAALHSSGVHVRAIAFDGVWGMLTEGEIPDGLGVPVGVRMAIGPSVQKSAAPHSWQLAAEALRFALPSTHDTGPYGIEEAVAVDSSQIGCLALLARYIPPGAIVQSDDVYAIDRLSRESGGRDMLRTLEAVAATESVRRAANTMHMHHNSVRLRVERAEEVLGFHITRPYGRVRLMTALTLWRLYPGRGGTAANPSVNGQPWAAR